MTENSTEIEVLPAARPRQSEALGQLMAHAEAMAVAHQFAEAITKTDLVPLIYHNQPGNATAAILYGAELGLTPIQSLQQIFVVYGMPAIYARTAVALVKPHGVIVETVSTSDDAVTVRATDRRTGQVEESTWDMARAEKAGYTGNKKYQTDPQAMLYAKAAMEVCRKIAPDVLLGIPYACEELELEPPPKRVASQRAGGVAALRERAAAQEQQAAAAGPTEPPPMSEVARRKWINRMFMLFDEGKLTQREDQLIAIAQLGGLDALPEHRDAIEDRTLREVVNILNGMARSATDDTDTKSLSDQLDDVLRAWEYRQDGRA